jgi:NADH-quinone oxidoreductase E subunit
MSSEERINLKEKCEKIVKNRPNVINILQSLQEEKGYLDRDEMLKISKSLDIPIIDLYGVATFYSLFKLEKQGKHLITVCSGTACHVKKSDKITEELEKILGIKRGNTTEDGKFTLETVNCIGACARAPAMMVDNEVYGELTPKKLKAIIDKY